MLPHGVKSIQFSLEFVELVGAGVDLLIDVKPDDASVMEDPRSGDHHANARDSDGPKEGEV